MLEEEIDQAAGNHAFEVLGEEQFNNNPDAVESIKGDFIEGANWAISKLNEDQ